MAKKIRWGISTLLALIILSLLVIPIIFKATIKTKVQEEISGQVNAKVEYGHFKLSFISSFPDLIFSFDNISVVGLEQFKEDTLAYIKWVQLSVDLVSIIKREQYKILAIKIESPRINLVRERNGKVNWDITKSATDVTSNVQTSTYSVNIDKICIRNGDLMYTDRTFGYGVKLYDLSFDAIGNIKNDVYNFTLKTLPVQFTYLNSLPSADTCRGIFNLSANFIASKSNLEHENYDSIHISGDVRIDSVYHTGITVANQVFMYNSGFSFINDSLRLDSLNIIYGKSHVVMKGLLNNCIAYLCNRGNLTGNLYGQSKALTVGGLTQRHTPSISKNITAGIILFNTPMPSYFKVPSNISLAVNFRLDTFYYLQLMVGNLNGQCDINDEGICFTDVSGNLLGGSAKLMTKYNTKNTDHPKIEFAYRIINMDMQKVYEGVKAIGEVSPALKYINGSFSGGCKGSGRLMPNMSLDYTSFMGNGKIEMPELKISQLPILNEISKGANIPSLQNLELRTTELNFTFNHGRIYIQPIDLNFTNGYSLYMQGSSGFDHTVDYNMKLSTPPKELISSSSLAKNILSLIPGLSNNLPQTLGFNFKVTGKADKPTVKLLKFEPGIN